jgi:hypothetical protein
VSFNREVIQRRPEEFKIAALRDVRSLFPDKAKPFYAGFGNRQTDVISYRAVGVPKGRIFTINPAGEIINVNATYKKTYSKLNDMVQEVRDLCMRLLARDTDRYRCSPRSRPGLAQTKSSTTLTTGKCRCKAVCFHDFFPDSGERILYDL